MQSENEKESKRKCRECYKKEILVWKNKCEWNVKRTGKGNGRKELIK